MLLELNILEKSVVKGERQGRGYRRFELAFPVQITIKSGQAETKIQTISKNVSVSGLLVRSTIKVAPNTLVAFILTVHGEHGVRPIHLAGEGEVVRVDAQVMSGSETSFALAVRCNALLMQLDDYLLAEAM